MKSTHFKWLKLSVLLFMVAGITGMVASLGVSVANWNIESLSFTRFRPLHTFFALMAEMTGVIGIVAILLQKCSFRRSGYLNIWMFTGMTFFIVLSSILIFAGNFSGREYFSWDPRLSFLPAGALISTIFLLFKHYAVFYRLSPEGFWLLGLGLLFTLGGLLESHFWLIPGIGNNIVKDLTVQWHGIDTFVAGLNASIYGGSIYFLQSTPKPLRKKWLYVIAVFSLLFTFGHHHYMSPQPHYLKILAFLASMVAMVSFIRHLRAFLKLKVKVNRKMDWSTLMLRSVEVWTIVSVASGVLFAIPQINFYIHGTYFVVIHAMGSMIGVNLLLIFLVGFFIHGKISPARERRIKFSVWTVNVALTGLWFVLGIAGFIKGLGRLHSNYWVFTQEMKPVLYFFPVLGGILTTAIIHLGAEIFIFQRRSIVNEKPKEAMLLTSDIPAKMKELT